MHNETVKAIYFLRPQLKGAVPQKTELNLVLYVLRTKLFHVKGVSLPAKITSENTSENDLRKSSDWFLKHTSNQNFLEGHFQRCFRRLFSPEEIPL